MSPSPRPVTALTFGEHPSPDKPLPPLAPPRRARPLPGLCGLRPPGLFGWCPSGLFLCGLALAACAPAHAQQQGPYYKATYSGGQALNTYDDSDPEVQNTRPDPYTEGYSTPNNDGAYDYGDYEQAFGPSAQSITFSGTINTTFRWQGTDGPPQAAILTQSCDAYYGNETGSGSSNNGLPNATGAAEDKTTYYSGVSSPGASYSLPGGCTPSVSVSFPADPDGDSWGEVGYTASLSPVTINPVGAAKDSSGNYDILIGQLCKPTLQGIPSALQGDVTNIQWTVTGATLQGWGGTATSAAAQGATSSYKYTQMSLSSPGPMWYWSDYAGTETITCKATVTPPSGQGSAFTVTVTRNVTLVVPAYTENDAAGVTRIDTSDPKISGYALWAGPSTTVSAGSEWMDSVTTPVLFASEGSDSAWAHLQMITVNGTHTSNGVATSVPNAGQTGLVSVKSFL